MACLRFRTCCDRRAWRLCVMAFDPAELPDDIDPLCRLITAERDELAAARAGLVANTLEIAKLKI